MTYAEKLKDPKWQKKRLSIFERDNWTCQGCGRNDLSLVIHHKDYLPGADPWDYPDEFLITLCETCHDKENQRLYAVIEFLYDLVLNSEVHRLIGNIQCSQNEEQEKRARADLKRAMRIPAAKIMQIFQRNK